MGGGRYVITSDPQLRHNDDEGTKATTPSQRGSDSAAEKQQKQQKQQRSSKSK